MNAFEWVQSASGALPTEDVYCATRDIAQARISTLRILLLKKAWSEEQSAYLTAIVGELVNNSFDHNLGTWRDIPGAWFEYQIETTSFRAFVADRGQGVLNSLKRALPKLRTNSEALKIAFTERLSGRTPENRGNGLKFVVRSLQKLPLSKFIFHSGDAQLQLGSRIDTNTFDRYIANAEMLNGVYTELVITK